MALENGSEADPLNPPAQLNNVRLCATVLKSVDQAFLLNSKSAVAMVREAASRAGTLDRLGEMEYSRGDRVTYHYFVGRILLSGHNIKAVSIQSGSHCLFAVADLALPPHRQAYKELRWSFDNCNVNNLRNLRRILVPLTACALILGIHPAPEILQELGLWEVFGPIISALAKGNGAQLMAALDRSKRPLRKWGVYLLLRDKLQVSCWRCLIRRRCVPFRLDRTEEGALADVCVSSPRSLLVYRASKGLEAARPTLELSELYKMARLAWQDAEMTVMDVESMVTSLIGQGYIKAYIQHEKGIIVFNQQDMGMVPMGKLYSSLA